MWMRRREGGRGWKGAAVVAFKSNIEGGGCGVVGAGVRDSGGHPKGKEESGGGSEEGQGGDEWEKRQKGMGPDAGVREADGGGDHDYQEAVRSPLPPSSQRSFVNVFLIDDYVLVFYRLFKYCAWARVQMRVGGKGGCVEGQYNHTETKRRNRGKD